MKIGFVGCGAIGSCYASILSKKHTSNLCTP